MQYVLDTNVVSALRVRGRNPQVEAWTVSVPVRDQFVTATTVAEIERCVIAKERSDPPQGEILRRRFEDRVLPAFADRVLPFGAYWLLASWPPTESRDTLHSMMRSSQPSPRPRR